MRLNEAIRRAEYLLPQLDSTDAAAVRSLVRVAKRVQRVREPLRQLERVLQEELNQTEMFDADD